MFRRLWLLILMLFLFTALLPATTAQADCDFSYSNYARAAQLHDMGDYARALRHYHCAQLEDPDDAIIPILIENVHEDIANAASAWSRPEIAARSATCDPAIDHAQLGVEAHEAGEDNWALIHLHCAHLHDPGQVDTLTLIGLIHINRGESHDAKNYFDMAARAAADAEEPEDLLVYLLGEDARSALANIDLTDVSLTSPDPAETGEYLPPGQHYQRTVLRVIWTSQVRLAEARQADDAAAVGRLEGALAQDPTRVELRCELGRRYMARGDYAAAYGQFSALIVERLGDHCGSAAGQDEASDAAPEPTGAAAVEPAPISPADEIFADGMRHLEHNRKFAAANTFLKALELHPMHVDARCQLGKIYTEWSHFRGALDQFDAILQQDAGDSCARRNRTIAAREMLAIFTPLVVDDYFHYARTYVRMAEWELARDAFLAGLEIDPWRHDARCELGMIYAHLGDDRAALNEFDLALFADDMDSCARANRYALLQRMRRF